MIDYQFDLSDDNPNGPVIQLCLDLQRTTAIRMKLNEFEDSFFDPDNLENGVVAVDVFLTAEMALGIDTRAFVDFFRDNPQECLEVL